MSEIKLQVKRVSLILVVLCFFSVSYSQKIEPKISLTGEILSFGNDGLKLKYTIENDNTYDNIYFATNPTQIYGEKGYYLLIDDTDSSLLKISGCVYPTPPYYLYKDSRNIELKKLNPGRKYEEIVFIKFPAKETDPPYNRNLREKREITFEEIKKIEMTLGYFVEERGILDFVQRKPWGLFMNGDERIDKGEDKGKSFLETQKLVSFEILVEEKQ